MNKTSIRWIKALLREGIMVASPSQLKGIRKRIETDVKKAQAERLAALIQSNYIQGSIATVGEVIDFLKADLKKQARGPHRDSIFIEGQSGEEAAVEMKRQGIGPNYEASLADRS